MATLFYPSEGFRTVEKNFTIAFFLPFDFQVVSWPLNIFVSGRYSHPLRHPAFSGLCRACIHVDHAACDHLPWRLLISDCSAQDDPPKPRDRLIVTQASPKSDMYVRSFGGFATQQGVLDQAAKLQEAVKEDGHDVLTGRRTCPLRWQPAGNDCGLLKTRRHII